MTIENVLFIRGIIVSDQTLRVLMGRRFPKLWEEYQKLVKEYKSDEFEEDPWQVFVMEYDGVERLAEKIGLEIHTWACCSELQNKKFVIGTQYSKADIWNGMAEGMVEVPELPSYLDKELTDKIMGYSDVFGTDLRSVMLLDDCTACS